MSELNYQNAEDRELRREENRLTHFEKLTRFWGRPEINCMRWTDQFGKQLEISRKLLSEAEQIDPECTEMHAGIETAFFQLEDSYRKLVNYCERVEAEPQRP
ncbi:MAG: hypothetical protein Ct9H300mP28_37470 [Pseudomonadota bacterium]|nr:MAG: hypothetical protein Ct9H300mP28_37470 [Pseudomonadota bacterium]